MAASHLMQQRRDEGYPSSTSELLTVVGERRNAAFAHAVVREHKQRRHRLFLFHPPPQRAAAGQGMAFYGEVAFKQYRLSGGAPG